MEKRHKDILRTLVAELRRTLAGTADGSRRGDLDRALERLGIAIDGVMTPFDALPNPTPAERHARQVAEAELAPVDVKERPAARAAFVERAAYGWVNRLLALRVLEARGLIDETLRGNPAYDGLSEALYVLRQSDPARASGPDGGWWAVIEDACATQATALPGLFALDSPRTAGSSSPLHDPAIALRPGATALVRCVELLGAPPAGTPKGQEEAALAEMDAAFADPDAIGWAYQFYQDEAKAQVYARLKAGKKVTTRDDISAATQLFTEPYMVQWLLQNSLGRSYHEAYPQSTLPAGWAYYIQSARLDAPAFPLLQSLTLLDPCVGSGHFLREAFDMFAAMYREQQPHLSAIEIADRILESHLYGIDIDPRAAQLAAFILYARAWELVRDERRGQRRPGTGSYTPKAMNLAASPERIAPGALARHLQCHPEDRMLEPLLKGVFATLERADMLGSLLRPREHLQAAITELRKPHNLRLGTVEEQDLQAAIETVVRTDPAHLEEMLLDRVAAGFAAEARDTGDVAAALFGRAAERGVRLLQLLDRQYAVVVTNPPYMGSANMDSTLRQYVERHYAAGKRDLYAALILRCLQLSQRNGYVAMVTKQGWLTDRSYADLRATSQDGLIKAREEHQFTGILRETKFDLLVQLGSGAFEEITGEVVKAALFTLRVATPAQTQTLHAIDLSGLKSVEERIQMLSQPSPTRLQHLTFRAVVSTFLEIESAPIVYSMPAAFQPLFLSHHTLGQGERPLLSVRDGMNTGDNDRFVRHVWEAHDPRWAAYSKGGGYSKWRGFEYFVVDWGNSGERIAAARLPGTRLQNITTFFTPALCYSLISQGALGVRRAYNCAYDGGGLSIQSSDNARSSILATLNSRLSSYFARLLSQDVKFRGGYIERVPQPYGLQDINTDYVDQVVKLKQQELEFDVIERGFKNVALLTDDYASPTVRHALEGLLESQVFSAYQVDDKATATVEAQVGTPVGWYPLVSGYDSIEPLTRYLEPSNVVDLLNGALRQHQRIDPDRTVLEKLELTLRQLYEAGPGGNVAIEAEADADGIVDVAKPIPAETFLEKLSQKLHIHPISVYWLLKKLRVEGARCKPEEQRLLEDRLSVIVLRLLGHCWPQQLEAREPTPTWADEDGIIPLLAGTSETTLADRARDRLRAEDGDLGVQQAEALLVELTGQNLEAWLRRTFFPRHVRQFKYRPIAWHLTSMPVAVSAGGGKGGKSRGTARLAPAFECLVYSHACGVGLLARLRTQYIEPMLRPERGRVDTARQSGDDTAAAQGTARVQELEAFVEGLRRVEERGFDTPDLEEVLAGEPLDRWSGDGILAPVGHEALLAQECAWVVDINDGVRVNIAPLQLAGLLASDVLKEADAKKALADRARWRSDERRWVREGVLPRCGWMAEDIPESPRWAERAPERQVEQHKLERKRAEAMARLAQGDGGVEE